jgi:acyl-CoA reductase-like NAD-dependent aldehyde dehydrogenase
MKELEMLQRDIDALLESVRSGWADMTAAERAELRQSITALVEQLQQLLSRMP